MKNPNINKHLTFEERCKIEEYINKGFRKYQIANELNKSQSTILREIRNNRLLKPRKIFNENPFNCIHLKDCKVCTGKCKYYETEKCNRRDKFIGACNNCPDIKKCKLDQYFYKAKFAHEKYRQTLVDARQGVNLNTSELFEIAHIICPLIDKGQSLYTILNNHPEIKLSVKTLYNYIEMGLFKDWGITNLSLKRKVKRKIRSKKLKKRNEPANYTGRKYEDYLQFKEDNPDVPTTEMDTVYTGEIRSKIFYCDAQMSSQKPHVENNHNFVREILPNGQSWTNLTQEKVNLVFSHINSTPRKSLGGKTPYEVFSFLYGENILKKLNIQKIAKDEVNTTPRLLK